MLATAIDAYEAEDYPKAEAILLGLVTIDPTNVRAYKLYASTLMLQGRELEAEAAYSRARELDPADLYTIVALGEIMLRTLRIEEAVPLFEELFSKDPQGLHPAANRGRHIVQTFYAQLSGESPKNPGEGQ